MSAPELSIIVPAYNEEELIVSTLDGLRAYFSSRPETYELIVVDDGSRDQTVARVNAWQAQTGASLQVVVNERNMGKGFSVRHGVEASRGQFLIFIDADLPYELNAVEGFLHALHHGADLAIGSRILPGSAVKGVPASRHFAGQVFSWIVQAFLWLGVADTQCGFKSFKASAAREIFRRLTITGFGFDVELLYVARKLKYHIQPVAVQMIHHRLGSRVRLFSHSLEMLADLFTIRWNDVRGKYK